MKKLVLALGILIASASTAWASDCDGNRYVLYNGAAIVGKYYCGFSVLDTRDILAGQTRHCCGRVCVDGPGFRGDHCASVPSGCRANQDQQVKVKLTGTIFRSGINWWCENR